MNCTKYNKIKQNTLRNVQLLTYQILSKYAFISSFFYSQNKYESLITSNTFDYGCDRLLYTVANQRGIWGYCVYEIATY